MLIFDAGHGDGHTTTLGTRLALVTDTVMGGRSEGTLRGATIAGRRALRMTGRVRLDNGGGFVQMACDLPTDASPYRALTLVVWGNGETYGVHLRTQDVFRPWQAYRQTFAAPASWTAVRLPLDRFLPHRLDAPFDPRTLRRLGLVAIGRAFDADLSVARIELE